MFRRSAVFRPQRAEPSFAEFVLICALMMGLVSLSLDNLLPAFGPIGAELAVESENNLQLLISVFMIGFAVMQPIYGPIADALGRRPVVLFGLIVVAAGSLLAITAKDFGILLAARAVQGLGAASLRVLAITIVRDRFEGREMARVMSLVMMIFIIVPVFAPATGSVLLFIGNWHLIFASTLALAMVVAIWFGGRMPETLHPEYRMGLSLRRTADGFRRTATTRESAGYATAMGLMFGCLITYISLAPQIFETDVYGLGPWFPAVFGAIAALMGVASYLNARLVRRLGMRRLSHAGLLGFMACAALQAAFAFAFDGRPPLVLFGALLGLAHFLFSLTVPNFNAMAMAPLGAIAGTASSLIGFYTTLIGALIAVGAGRAFDGTVTPLPVTYLAVSVACLGIVLWTEKGRLFRPQHPDPAPETTTVQAPESRKDSAGESP